MKKRKRTRRADVSGSAQGREGRFLLLLTTSLPFLLLFFFDFFFFFYLLSGETIFRRESDRLASRGPMLDKEMK